MNDSKGNGSANVGLFLWEKPALYYKGQKPKIRFCPVGSKCISYFWIYLSKIKGFLLKFQ